MEPREVEIEALQAQIANVNLELASSHARNKSQDAVIGGLREDIKNLSSSMDNVGDKVNAKDAELKSFERNLYNLVSTMGGRGVDAINVARKLTQAHAPPKNSQTVSSTLDLDVIAESVRQQQHLTQLSKDLRKQATSRGSALAASNAFVGPSDASTLITENTALISQINSLKDVIKKIRSETTHLLFGVAK